MPRAVTASGKRRFGYHRNMSNTQGRAQQRREVSSSAHPGRPCQPCILCKKGNLSKYFHPKTIKDKASLEKLRQLEPMLAIEPSSCICRNCRDDLSKLSESSFIPRWRKNRERSECSVPEGSIFPQKVSYQGTNMHNIFYINPGTTK